MQNLEQRIEKCTSLPVLKENWLSGAADRVRQARRGHGFHTGPTFSTVTRLIIFALICWFPVHKKTRIDVSETLCPQQMLVHKGGKIKNWGWECRDVTPTKSLSQNIRVDVKTFFFFFFFFFGGGGGSGRGGGGGGVGGWGGVGGSQGGCEQFFCEN